MFSEASLPDIPPLPSLTLSQGLFSASANGSSTSRESWVPLPRKRRHTRTRTWYKGAGKHLRAAARPAEGSGARRHGPGRLSPARLSSSAAQSAGSRSQAFTSVTTEDPTASAAVGGSPLLGRKHTRKSSLTDTESEKGEHFNSLFKSMRTVFFDSTSKLASGQCFKGQCCRESETVN